jgi:hypothetical protein
LERNPSIKITLTQFNEAMSEFGIYSLANKLFAKLASYENDLPNRTPITQSTSDKKLARLSNPRSKHYDSTPDLTSQLSLLLYNYQRSNGRFYTKRLTKEHKQYLILVKIKRAILDTSPVNFVLLANRVLQEGESICKRMGKNNIYLSIVLHHIQEILDKSVDSLRMEITDKQLLIYQIYREMRTAITSVPMKEKLTPGSDTHNFVAQIEKIVADHKVRVRDFMIVQFEAFEHFGSFPRLSNLVGDKAIDRLEQAIVSKHIRRNKKVTSEERKYWDAVRKHRNTQ